MKKLFSFTALAAIFVLCFAPAAPAGESITYPGLNVHLQRDPGEWSIYYNSLFPGTTANPGRSGNRVRVVGNVGGFVFGGVTMEDYLVTNNTVIIESCWVGESIFGGYSALNIATNNTVSIDHASIRRDVFGGFSVGGFFSEVPGLPPGGVLFFNTGGNATNNSVSIVESIFDRSDPRLIFPSFLGGRSEHNAATDNKITIFKSDLRSVYGGDSFRSDATNNSVTIEESAAILAIIYGGWGARNATGNTITINDMRTANAHIFGGFSYGGFYSHRDEEGHIIEYIDDDGFYMLRPSFIPTGGNATGNTVELSYARGLISQLFGGALGERNTTGDAFTGNTLNFSPSDRALQVDELANFEFINFYLPGNVANGGTILTAERAWIQYQYVQSEINVRFVDDAPARPLRVNDRIILIDASHALHGTPRNTTVGPVRGRGHEYTFALSVDADGRRLIATVTEVTGSGDPRRRDDIDGCNAGMGTAGMLVLVAALWLNGLWTKRRDKK